MEKGLYVQTLGAFVLTYEGRLVPIENSGTTKMMRLLLAILLAGKNGVDRSFLIGDLYQEEVSSEKAAVKLRVNLHRLRRFLIENGFPGENCIIKEGSCYKWNVDLVSVDTDLWHFMGQYRELWENRNPYESRKEKLNQILLLYKGKFLPAITGCDWVTQQRDTLQDIYEKCRKDLENQEMVEAENGFFVVKDFLRKNENQRGACYCARTSFLDACRITKDRIKRLGGNANLMFCTMSCSESAPESQQDMELASDRMREAAGVLRRSDFYTDFGQGKFMFLLTGASVKPIDCGRTRERLEEAFWGNFPKEKITLNFAYEAL